MELRAPSSSEEMAEYELSGETKVLTFPASKPASGKSLLPTTVRPASGQSPEVLVSAQPPPGPRARRATSPSRRPWAGGPVQPLPLKARPQAKASTVSSPGLRRATAPPVLPSAGQPPEAGACLTPADEPEVSRPGRNPQSPRKSEPLPVIYSVAPEGNVVSGGKLTEERSSVMLQPYRSTSSLPGGLETATNSSFFPG